MVLKSPGTRRLEKHCSRQSRLPDVVGSCPHPQPSGLPATDGMKTRAYQPHWYLCQTFPHPHARSGILRSSAFWGIPAPHGREAERLGGGPRISFSIRGELYALFSSKPSLTVSVPLNIMAKPHIYESSSNGEAKISFQELSVEGSK